MINYLAVFFYLSALLGYNFDPNFLFLADNSVNSNKVEKIFYMSEAKEKEGIISLLKNTDKIDIVAPQFYGVSANLKLNGRIEGKLKKAIQQAQSENKNLKVMPLVANYAFKQDIMHNLLISTKAQEEIIASLIIEAKKENYIGWQFDFENISYLDKERYSIFVEKTAEAFHENNLILSLAVVSRSVDYEDTDFFKNWSGVFDYERLSKVVDFISLMVYDDPNSVGPVASAPFTRDVLNYVKDKIPSEKLSFGIPLYNWGWCADTSKKIIANGTYDGLLYIKSNYNCKEGFDSNLGSAWLSYYWENKEYKIWHQDKKTFDSKLNIIKENNFRGFSAWVLGVEDPDIWLVLD